MRCHEHCPIPLIQEDITVHIMWTGTSLCTFKCIKTLLIWQDFPYAHAELFLEYGIFWSCFTCLFQRSLENEQQNSNDSSMTGNFPTLFLCMWKMFCCQKQAWILSYLGHTAILCDLFAEYWIFKICVNVFLFSPKLTYYLKKFSVQAWSSLSMPQLVLTKILTIFLKSKFQLFFWKVHMHLDYWK